MFEMVQKPQGKDDVHVKIDSRMLLQRSASLYIAVKTNTGCTPKLHRQHLDSIDQKRN